MNLKMKNHATVYFNLIIYFQEMRQKTQTSQNSSRKIPSEWLWKLRKQKSQCQLGCSREVPEEPSLI